MGMPPTNVPLHIRSRQPFSLITHRAEDSEGKPPSLDVAT